MAIGYWDTDTGTTSGGLDYWNLDRDTTGTATTTSASYSGGWEVVTSSPPPRKIIVKHPEDWDRKKTLRYVDLINVETNTGWKVDMIIEGDIVITDPSIEIREMMDFVPMLKRNASSEDIDRINNFFAQDEVK